MTDDEILERIDTLHEPAGHCPVCEGIGTVSVPPDEISGESREIDCDTCGGGRLQ